MHLEILTFCDAARDYTGRLSIIGGTDTIHVGSLPAKLDSCCIVVRLRMSKVEEGAHKVRLVIMNADGKQVVNMEGQMNVNFAPEVPTVAANLIVNIRDMQLNSEGEHSVDVAVDGVQVGSTPLFVRTPRPQGA